MKKITKKIGLAITGAATIAAPIATVISCGSGGVSRYDTTNDGKLQIAATFGATSVQSKGMEAIIDTYNNWLGKHPEKITEGYMPMKDLVTISGGYGKATADLRKKFQAKDKDTVSNLVIDYPDSAAIMKSYDMQLNFKDVLTADQATELEGRFEESFWKQNSAIGGLDKDGIWSVPISVSSMANAINTPVFAYILGKVKAAYPNAFNAAKTTKINEIIEQGKKAPGDMTVVGNLWGDFTESDATKFEDNSITDAILNEWDSLLEFGVKAQSGFKKANSDNDKHLFAFDSPTNLIQMLSYGYADGNMDDYYVNIDKETGYVNFEFLKDKKSPAYKHFMQGLELLKKAVDSKALWIGGAGAYGSSELVYHRAMMSIGSTAGASHWYVDGGTKYYVQLKAGDTAGPSSMRVKGMSDAIASGTKDVLGIKDDVLKFGSHDNRFIDFADIETAKTAEDAKYSILLNTNNTNVSIKEDFNNGFNILFEVAKDDKAGLLADIKSAGIADDAIKQIGTKFDVNNAVADTSAYYFLMKDSGKVKALTSDSTLQETEVKGVIPPTKIKGKDKGGVYVQGPSLIPVHANTAEDKALGLFVMWMTNSTEKYDWDKYNKDLTVLQYWLAKANYIAPLKGAFEDNSTTSNKIKAGLANKYTSKYWKGASIAWDIFNQANGDDNLNPIVQPVDDFTSIARNSVTDPIIKGMYTKAHVDGSTRSVDAIYDELIDSAKDNEII